MLRLHPGTIVLTPGYLSEGHTIAARIERKTLRGHPRYGHRYLLTVLDGNFPHPRITRHSTELQLPLTHERHR